MTCGGAIWWCRYLRARLLDPWRRTSHRNWRPTAAHCASFGATIAADEPIITIMEGSSMDMAHTSTPEIRSLGSIHQNFVAYSKSVFNCQIDGPYCWYPMKVGFRNIDYWCDCVALIQTVAGFRLGGSVEEADVYQAAGTSGWPHEGASLAHRHSYRKPLEHVQYNYTWLFKLSVNKAAVFESLLTHLLLLIILRIKSFR